MHPLFPRLINVFSTILHDRLSDETMTPACALSHFI
jgi:hypothetical protein